MTDLNRALLNRIIKQRSCSGIKCNECPVDKECRIESGGGSSSPYLIEIAKRKLNLLVNLEKLKSIIY